MARSDQAVLGEMAIDHTEFCGNADIIALVAIIDMGLYQLGRCPSATRNDCQQADVDICKGLISRFRQNFELFAGTPELYLPNAAPKPKKMPEPPQINIVQNPAIQHQMYELSHLRTQLLFSEDAERLSGFHSKTSEVVILPWIEKFESYNDAMAENVDPSNADRTFMPDANRQDAGVNPGHPR